jgi:hypothetical protein
VNISLTSKILQLNEIIAEFEGQRMVYREHDIPVWAEDTYIFDIKE